jgi:hypothetical protein
MQLLAILHLATPCSMPPNPLAATTAAQILALLVTKEQAPQHQPCFAAAAPLLRHWVPSIQNKKPAKF